VAVVPGRLVLRQGVRHDVLGQPVEAIREIRLAVRGIRGLRLTGHVPAPLGPGGGEPLVRGAPEQQRAGIDQLLHLVACRSLIEEGEVPQMRILDHAIDGVELGYSDLSHASVPFRYLQPIIRSATPRAPAPLPPRPHGSSAARSSSTTRAAPPRRGRSRPPRARTPPRCPATPS